MKIDQLKFEKAEWHSLRKQIDNNTGASFALVFGDRFQLEDQTCIRQLNEMYPGISVITSSSSGDILNTDLSDGERIVATVVSMEKTPLDIRIIQCKAYASSYKAGKALSLSIPKDGLKHVFVISDGQIVNGSELVKGIHSELSDEVTVSGGLAGDQTRFQSTLVGLNDNIAEGNIVAISFYGEKIKVGLGSMGGWDSFGPEREITNAKGNVLLELDGENALDLYKIYLGDKAKDLPGSALLFPLQIIVDGKPEPLVRTILNVNENDKSMIFAGDIPVGARAQFMKANFDKLIDGASIAAEYALKDDATQPELALLVSCIGRKLVLGQRTEEELEAVKDVLGDQAAITGFYSYGELCPTLNNRYAELHNQTMTITTLKEL
jgi:hypothetical protein